MAELDVDQAGHRALETFEGALACAGSVIDKAVYPCLSSPEARGHLRSGLTTI